MKPKKITFLFNQLTLPELCTGGEIRGHTIASFFQNDKNFNVEIITSEIGAKSFSSFKKKIIGHQSFEKYLNHQTLFSSFILLNIWIFVKLEIKLSIQCICITRLGKRKIEYSQSCG